MVPIPSFQNVPNFAEAGVQISPPGGAYSTGYLAGQVLPAEFENYFLGSLTKNGNTEQQAITSTVTELDNLLAYFSITPVSGTNTQIRDLVAPYLNMVQTAVTNAGLPFTLTDAYMLDKAMIASSFAVGENRYLDYKLTQVTFPNAQSSANPGNPRYCPVILRDVDKTVTTSQAPNLVPLLRAFTASVLGNMSFTVTVSGSNVTWSLTTTNTAALNALVNEGYVRRWFSSGQSANFAASGPDFTGMSVNINGTDFAIVSINLGTGVMVVTGTPTTGSQTVILYPYRIVGSTTSIQLPRLSGFLPAGSDDIDGTQIGGYRIMDMTQNHEHPIPMTAFGSGGGGSVSIYATGAGSLVGSAPNTSPMTSDGSDGTPRGGKKTAPQTTVKFIYTHVDYLIAAV